MIVGFLQMESFIKAKKLDLLRHLDKFTAQNLPELKVKAIRDNTNVFEKQHYGIVNL